MACTSLEWANVKDHAHDHRDAEPKKDQRGYESERGREWALAMDETICGHLLSRDAQTKHELRVIDDANGKHNDAEQDQRDAEMTRRTGGDFHHVFFFEIPEYLKDGESEADERKGRADHRHQRAVRAQARTL